jgi:hypothetical protein
MELFLGGGIMIAWFAVVIWGATSLVIQAKQTKDWGKVGVAALSSATVSGPLLILMPEHIFFGIHTMGLGFVLTIISAMMILLSRPQLQRLLI